MRVPEDVNDLDDVTLPEGDFEGVPDLEGVPERVLLTVGVRVNEGVLVIEPVAVRDLEGVLEAVTD